MCKTCGEENADRNVAFNIAYRALGYISKVGVTVNIPITLASTGRSSMTRKRLPVWPVVVHDHSCWMSDLQQLLSAIKSKTYYQIFVFGGFKLDRSWMDQSQVRRRGSPQLKFPVAYKQRNLPYEALRIDSWPGSWPGWTKTPGWPQNTTQTFNPVLTYERIRSIILSYA